MGDVVGGVGEFGETEAGVGVGEGEGFAVGGGGEPVGAVGAGGGEFGFGLVGVVGGERAAGSPRPRWELAREGGEGGGRVG